LRSELGLSSVGFRFPRQLPTPQSLVHVYPDPNAIGTHFHTDLPIVASAHPFLRSGLDLPVVSRERDVWIEAGARGYTITSAAQAAEIAAEAMSARGPVVGEVRSDVRQTIDRSLAAVSELMAQSALTV
jgi:thiamine pyrophosphate-dependent acetolactate synthase large subunit-like protein